MVGLIRRSAVTLVDRRPALQSGQEHFMHASNAVLGSQQVLSLGKGGREIFFSVVFQEVHLGSGIMQCY
jgi:hypothetical protein